MIPELQNIGINLSHGGEQRFKCPFCSPNRSKPNDLCLSVNISNNAYKCHKCGVSGGINSNSQNKSEYRPNIVNKDSDKPQYKETPLESLSEGAIEFLKKRGISEEVAKNEGLACAMKWVHKFKSEKRMMAFPFIKGNKRVATKYRDSVKNMTQDTGGEKCFYRFDEMKKGKNIYVTEGEIDALSLVQCGFSDGVTSVPDGAPNPTSNNLDNKFSFMTDEAMKIFDEAEKIYLVVDNDENGRFLQTELKRRIGIEKCLMVEYPEGCKDINEVLMIFGEDRVREVIAMAKHFPVSGLNTFNDYYNDILDMIDGITGDHVQTGWSHMDKHLKVKTGQLNILTGSPGSGKSEWLDALMINTIKSDNWKWGVFSPENYPPQVYFRKLASKYCDMDFNSLSCNEIPQTCVSLSKNITLIVDNDEDDVNLDYLFERIRVLVFRFGIKGIIIDPWNEITHDIGSREDLYLNKVLRKIKRFIRKYDISFWLVAHPRNPKRNADGTYPKITAYDIAGGYAWFAKADNVFSVWRDKTDNRKPVEVEIQKIKQKTDGTLGTCYFYYQYDSGNFKSCKSSLDEYPVCEDQRGSNVNGLTYDDTNEGW